MGGLWAKLLSLFFSKQLEIVLVGLQNSGKTTFARKLDLNDVDGEKTAPTIGLSVKLMSRGGVNFKIWDIGGQAQYRSEWPRYTKGCDVIVFVVDVADPETISEARKELHCLLEDRELGKMPLLVLANKIDKPNCIAEKDLIKGLNLDYIMDNPWMVTPISALRGDNVDKALEFLMKHSH